MASTSPTPQTAVRSSGRVRKQPATYTSSPAGSSKRKRSNDVAEDDADMADEDDSESGEDDEDEEDADEEELRDRKAKARKAKSTKKPAAKKPKTNGAALPVRSAPGVAKRRAPRKAKGIAGDDAEAAGGLYAEVFASGETIEAIAANWIKAFDEHASSAVADLINFVLRCAGCTGTVDASDIEDPDGATNKLDDLREEYQATKPTEYPLITKGKASKDFKNSVVGFFHVFIKTIAASGHLFSNPELIENIEVWLSTMSSAPNRSFRHTATVACLSIVTALCEVAHDNAEETAKHQQMVKTENKKAKPNKSRVLSMEKTIKEKTEFQDFVEALLKDWFHAVFIHRYRDIDPAIRKDSIASLGDWIITMPSIFFDGSHLRYLGWLLSDTAAAIRGEVLKQLSRLYKDTDKLGGLKTFTEKFRSRLVEIATNDADVHVRVSGIELLDILRENGLLEPDDIDAVGRLIFDTDVRARKAVAQFFAENVQDLYSSKMDDLGGSEALEGVIPETADGNYDAPNLEWLKFKSLTEMLHSYDVEDILPEHIQRSKGDERFTLEYGSSESRFVLAAESLYDTVDEIKEWRTLGGYLLFDHSVRTTKKRASTDPLSQLKHECKLEESEEAILLEVLTASVRREFTDLAEKLATSKAKLTKKQKENLQEEREEGARQLVNLIPRLLKKFGDAPSTAAAVLRTESVLNLPSLSDLRQDSTTYATLLDNVRKQFMSHGTDDVLGPASSAILHAKSYGELDDLTEERVAGLWEDVVNNLAELITIETITVRAASTREEMVALSNNLLRIIHLSTVSNCIQALEDNSIASSNEAADVKYDGAIDYIIALVERAILADGPAPDDDEAFLEDQIASRAAQAAQFYFFWKFNSIVTAAEVGSGVSFDELEPLAIRRDAYVDNLKGALDSRKASEDISVALSEAALQVFSGTALLRDAKPKPGNSDDYTALFLQMDPNLQTAIMKVFSAAEKRFAKLANKKLGSSAVVDEDEMDVDADPIDEDPISDPESEEEQDDEAANTQTRKETKALHALLAEQRLCSLTGRIIHAILSRVVDVQSCQPRLERNKTRLGNNYKECCAYLDTAKDAKSKTKGKTNGKSAPATAKKNAKSNAIVAEDELDDDVSDVDHEENPELIPDNEPEAEEEDAETGANGEVESLLGD
ncbi:STAG-domain-containing protein [Acrodontium crateriforme]|uniref:STAG-domain-containing protein n=1 Tax=Acrodontium crateriforme TaxID=150365 RepID=A0AAQ3R6R2_9PEZI|nr:STAG-domain-containing protein [Acrodontium crateriforme]